MDLHSIRGESAIFIHSSMNLETVICRYMNYLILHSNAKQDAIALFENFVNNEPVIMNGGKLFVSFWDLCLDNLPPGEFTHRCIAPYEARLRIEQARRDRRLLGVSQTDLLAPHHKAERQNYQTLCKVLHEHFSISIFMNDFFHKDESFNDSLYTITPLSCAQVKDSHRLLVVNCSYRFSKKEPYSSSVLEVEPESIEFHIIESREGFFSLNGRPSFGFHALPERLSA